MTKSAPAIYSTNVYVLPLFRRDIDDTDWKTSPAHKGNLRWAVDFTCDEGCAVRASLEGIVRSVKQDSDCGGFTKQYWNDGNRIEIEHANGEHTAYEHLEHHGARVRVGEYVKTGQVIGRSGNTGFSSGPHLHFEVFVKTGLGEDDILTRKVRFRNEKIY